MVQRRDLAVFLGAKALQPGLAGVDDDMAHPCPGDGFDELRQDRLRVLVIDADAAFYRDRHVGLAHHRADAVGDKGGPFHQDRAETAGLHPVRGAAAVQVDLVIAPGPGDPAYRLGQLARVGAAKLQGDRVFHRRVVQQARFRAVDDGGGGDHLGIQHRPPGHLPVEDTAMPVRPVHHGGDGEAVGTALQRTSLVLLLISSELIMRHSSSKGLENPRQTVNVPQEGDDTGGWGTVGSISERERADGTIAYKAEIVVRKDGVRHKLSQTFDREAAARLSLDQAP